MPPRIFVTLESAQLGLKPGTLDDLDRAVAKFPREHILLRTIAVLHALSADRDNGHINVNRSFADAVGGDNGRLLAAAMRKDNARFLEPLQQLVILRRAMTLCAEKGSIDIASDEGVQNYFDACRFAADITSPGYEVEGEELTVDKWLKVAAGFSTRLWLTNPPNPNHGVARMRLMLDRLPEERPELKKYSDALKERFPTAADFTYEQASTLATFLSYWALGPKLEEILEDHSRIRLNPETWLRETDIPVETFKRFLDRAARDWTDGLSDSSYGGPLTVLPFKDRPLIRFHDQTVAPVVREFVLEKLTSDIFWWVKDPNSLQAQPWQTDWGQLGEAYVLWLLEKLAAASNCEFKRNVKWAGGELDAAVWFKGHVALIEITSSSLSDLVAFSGDWRKFEAGLHQAFVQSTRPGKRPYSEAVLQLSRDAKTLLEGKLAAGIPVQNIQRIYPVMIALDRKLRVPGAWHYLDQKLKKDLGESAARCSALVPLNLDDVEELEQLMHDRRREFRGTPPGFLRILRRWDTDRGVGPSWWQFMEYVAGQTRVNRFLVEESARWKEEIKSHFKVDPWVEEQ